ncbi:hypothetical protein FSP39_023579 [Pinctada imbricata]|uniref:RFX-type winged-helix domain-containing protein n=1 Tax=Pinctada imbricata TaxID=66713 RepID=A0AA89BU88_PINIB|nr:hypothetical protein FSP39_023579 [Pinctada imbricata]
MIYRTPTSCIHASNRLEHGQAYTWIKSHLEEDSEICLPKQDVYEDYKQYCDIHNIRSLSIADFGKLMKSVFPNVKPRRLGQRGQSRYPFIQHLIKKLDIEAPSLPELVISPKKEENQKNEDDELVNASCHLVLEWASKLLSQNFTGVRELSEFLVSNLYVNSKSVAAFTVIAAMQESGMQNVKVPSLFNNTTGGDRHRETQLQLQRKLQERELLAKQKKKLQQQKEENQQRLRQSHERQTPLITSPTIQQVLMSPARRIFDEARGEGAKSVLDSDMLRSQSVTMFTPVSDSSNLGQIRSKSTTSVHFDIDSTNIAAEPQVLENSVPIADQSQQTRKRTDSDSAMEVSQICDQEPAIPKVISRNNAHDVPMDATNRPVSNETSMEVSSSESEIKAEKKSVYHTIRKPAVVKRGGIWTVPGTETECTITKVAPGTMLSTMKGGTNTCDSSRKQPENEMQEKAQVSQVIDGSMKRSDKTIYVQSVHVSKPSIPQNNHEVVNSHLCLKKILGTSNISSMPQLSLSTPALNNPPSNAGQPTELVTKQQVISSTSSVSARSAFVPFSQVSNRKDLPCEISVTTSPSILCLNKQKFRSMDNLTQSGNNQNQGLILKDGTLIADSNSLVVLGTNPSISDFVKTTNNVNSVTLPTTVSASLPISNTTTGSAVSSLPSESTIKSLSVDTSAIVRSNSNSVTVPTSIYVSPSPVCSSSESSSVPSSVQSSPSTPKKTKSRFTPIRPKASPAKTVSTILKENKSAALDSDRYDKSRPVAELLKEKRAREAQQQSGKPSHNSSSITTSVTTPVPQLIPQQLPLSIQGGTLPVADKGNIFIILSANPAITPTTSATPISNMNTPINSTINTITTCRPDISAIGTKDLHSTSLSSRQSRSRTNSSSEREFESPIPSKTEQLNVSDLSDHADCSPGNDEKPSKLIKIVDNECNVSSRPGSRGSVEREETPLSFLGRKRKFFNSDNGNSFIVRQNSKKFDSIDDGDEEMQAVPTEALTCSAVKKNLDKTNSFDATVPAKTGHNQYYPNISDLENDALLDLSDDQVLLMNKPRSKVSVSKNQQSTAVGVNSLSLTHQKFLKEKKMLDQRMKLFSQQREPTTSSQALPENQTNMKLEMANEQSQNASGDIEMEAESELPPDVADFITDAMTGIENTRIHSADPEKEQMMETTVSVDYSKSPIMVERHLSDGSRSASEIEQLQKIKEHLKSPHQGLTAYKSLHISPNMAQDGTYQQRSHSVTFTEPEIPHSTAHINMVRSQSVTFPDATEIMTHVDIGNLGSLQRKNEISQHSRRAQHQTTSKNIGIGQTARHEQQQPVKEQFISPQVPMRRQRTPSVELGTNQSNSKLNSIVQSTKRSQKEMSVERVINQTPFSDPGYGSVGPSPVHGTSNVLSSGICDSTYSSMTSSHLSGRPDSAQSLASDNIAPSPVSLASPRFSTSTPYPLRSPCPTPNQAILMSPGPGENNGPIRFMPIQATTYKTNNSVTLIKPVVTVASQCLSDDKKLTPQATEVFLPKVVSAPIKPPPPYTTAVQQQHCKDISGTVSLTSNALSRNAEGAFILLADSNKPPPSALAAPPQQELPLTGELPQEDLTPHFLEKHGQNSYPFSNFFAQLSSRSKSTDQPPDVTSPETEIQNETRNQDKNEIINNILGHLKSPLSHTRRQKFDVDGSNQIMQTLTDLPNANYRGNQPNVDISGLFEEGNNQILTNHLYQDDLQMNDQVFHEDEFTAKRSLTFNDQFDLQTTLDVLKDVDSEYFQHDTFDVEGSKRQ